MTISRRPQVGLLITGHDYYWDQFPELKAKGLSMSKKVQCELEKMADIFVSELVDTPEKSAKAGLVFRDHNVDLLLVFPVGYTPSMQIVPAVQLLNCPIRLLNTHEDRSYDYDNADTTEYLHHEGVCCIPEFSSALVSLGRKFRVRSGSIDDARLIAELQSDFTGAAAASRFREMNVGLIGQGYTGMTDMPIDEHRLLRATGKLLVRPEIEEVEEAYRRVDDESVRRMIEEIRSVFEVAEDVTNEHLRFSSEAALAYEEVITRHDISAFGYYWWGEKEHTTQLRAQSSVAVSRLGSMGRPGVTEGDVKSALGLKLMDLLGAGGMFTEFFSMDYEEDFILMGHDGPANINMSKGKPRLQHLKVHHGKSGHGLGIDFDMATGMVTLLNITQFGEMDTFKLLYTVGEIVPGPILKIGNPNCRVKVKMPLHEFIDQWCQAGPSHHIVLGYGDKSVAIETFAESMGFATQQIE